jgi:hypothetical protein
LAIRVVFERRQRQHRKAFRGFAQFDEEDLPNHLRQIISLLKSKDAPVNWRQLLRELSNGIARTKEFNANGQKDFGKQKYGKRRKRRRKIMILELHLIQNFAPSNLNRSDTGSPKDCTFGGFRRREFEPMF